MQKILFLLLIFVVFGGGYLILSEKQIQEKNVVRSQNQVAENEAKKMAFSEFIKSEGSYQCSVRDYLSDFESEGTIYFDNERLRGDLSTVAEGSQVNSSVIMKEGYTYMWEPSEKKGVVVSSRGELSSSYVWTPNQVGEYDCNPWVVDESKFIIPETIKFQTIAS